MESGERGPDKPMKLRYPGVCRVCGVELVARQEAVYERGSRTVRCLECPGTAVATQVRAPDLEPVPESLHESGTAGASARREYERRRSLRESRVRESHPRLGGLILALSDDPQSTRAWASGARGEVALGARLDKQSSESLAVLHDRRIPGTKANIDHLVVSRGGVFVIDAKRYVDQRPELRVDGGILRTRVERLLVGGRDRTGLVEGVLGQVDMVRAALDDPRVDVTGTLCFIEADWPLIGPSFSVRGIRVVSPRRLSKLLAEADGDVDVPAVRDRIAAAFPRA